jgi:hypothetical protein
MERKDRKEFINRLQAQNPAHARAGFLLFRGRISVIGRLILQAVRVGTPLPLK